MHEVQYPLFLLAPADLLDLWVQMVVPPLSALLPNSSRQVFSDQRPFLRAILFNQVEHHAVFLLSPRPFDKRGVQYFLPTVETLNISAAWQVLSNLFPVFASVTFDGVRQLVILKPF